MPPVWGRHWPPGWPTPRRTTSPSWCSGCPTRRCRGGRGRGGPTPALVAAERAGVDLQGPARRAAVLRGLGHPGPAERGAGGLRAGRQRRAARVGAPVLRLFDVGGALRIEVEDANPAPPVSVDGHHGRVGGYGMRIVERLADGAGSRRSRQAGLGGGPSGGARAADGPGREGSVGRGHRAPAAGGGHHVLVDPEHRQRAADLEHEQVALGQPRSTTAPPRLRAESARR